MKNKSEFVCLECGYKSTKWYGKCPSCNNWNTLEEIITETENERKSSFSREARKTRKSVTIDSISVDEHIRIKAGIGEFDRVLGGGIVSGSVVLLSGEPGIGKSTLLLQICATLGENTKLLYVSGEESQGQIKLRAQRLGIDSDNIYIYTETEINDICDEIEIISPDVVVIDSIQTMYDENSSTIPGSVTQVKNSTQALIRVAKTKNIATIIVGHVNKDGAIAGPKVLEHMVDTVLYFEGDKQHTYRMLRAVKNRFGSTNEIGVFEMQQSGLCEIENPSEMLLSQRTKDVSGSCTLCVVEGTRPILAEIQALVSQTAYPMPKRMSAGVDYNRLSLIIAVLEKRLGLKLSTQDVYLNVVGGMRLDEPACDLAVCMALVSGLRDVPLDEKMIAFGEVGLSGEIRTVSRVQARVNEAARLGFTQCILPKSCIKNVTSVPSGIELIGVKNIKVAISLIR